MLHLPIYMDNHATTRLDPRVLEAMLPYFTETFGNAGSSTHSFGHAAKEAVDAARQQIAEAIGARPKEIVFTSGATESNNLAIKGVAGRHGAARQTRYQRRHRTSVRARSARGPGPARLRGHVAAGRCNRRTRAAGLIRVEQVAEALRDDTILVSVMLANNEIGVHPTGGRDRAAVPPARRAAAHRRHAGGGQDSRRRRTTASRLDELHRAQDLRPEGRRRPVRAPPRAAGAVGAADRRRRTGRRAAKRNAEHAGHRGLRPGAAIVPGRSACRIGPAARPARPAVCRPWRRARRRDAQRPGVVAARAAACRAT